MLNEVARSASTRLVRQRASALGVDLDALAAKYRGIPPRNVANSIATAKRQERPRMGLVASHLTLLQATKSGNPAELRTFAFRLGAHMKLCAELDDVPIADQTVLAQAAEVALSAAGTCPPHLLSKVKELSLSLDPESVTDDHWVRVIGMTEGEYRGSVAQVIGANPAKFKGQRQTVETTRHKYPAPRQPDAETMPSWLRIGVQPPSDRLLESTRNWNIDDVERTGEAHLSLGWTSFIAGDYVGANSQLSRLYSTLGAEWGPAPTTDGLRIWHWLRLVRELAARAEGQTSDRRRSAASAFELAYRCLPDDDSRPAELLSEALDDFRASDPATIRAWCAYTARIVACCGHEFALENYDNGEKAQLRSAWSRHFIGIPLEAGGSTASMAASLSAAFREVTQRLYVTARDDTNSGNVLRALSGTIRLFLDETEAKAFDDTTEAILEVSTRIDDGSYNLNELVEHQSALMTTHSRLAKSSSLLLQDLLAPHIVKTLIHIDEARERLGNISRPEVAVRLESARLPFSATPGTAYRVRLITANPGNTPAERIQIDLASDELATSGRTVLDHLGVGAEDTVEVDLVSTSMAPPAATLKCNVSWSDAALQEFSSTFLLAAENQRPAAWTSADINPFSLGTISEASRLVGRDDDLAALEALVAGGGSAYVTGHKRVGKTSLIRVLIEKRLPDRGWGGSVFSLGRALGPEQLAEDLVYTLMEEIYSSISDAYPSVARSIEEFNAEPGGNFARTANRWLRRISQGLPKDARVAIAVDDFDELPETLITGPQADSLFLFLRSIVDERWLNLIVVGSEVLPSVIQGQAHKLNQVVPVSVTNFSSRSSTAALLETPTKQQLEWDPRAIDHVHHVCRGNPYYETLVAQRIWDDLRERERTFVTTGDVDNAADFVARTAPASHFVHLWADGTSGMDHISRRAIVTSAVLRAVARCGGPDGQPARVDEVINVAQTWIQTATGSELQQLISSLLDREVLENGPNESSVLISIPLASIWMGNAGARELDLQYSRSSHATETVKLVTDSDLVSLSRGLTYRGESISEIRIRDWLQQFGDNYHQYLAYKMLRRVVKDGFFSPNRLHQLVTQRLREVIALSDTYSLVARDSNGYMQNGYLLAHGRAGDSTQGVTSWLCKTLKIKKSNVITVDDVAIPRINLRDPGAVLFILDDYCGSGGHIRSIFHDVLDRLPNLGESWREDVHIFVGAGVVGHIDALPKSPEGGPNVERVAGQVLGPRFRAFGPDSGVFDTDEERADAEEMVSAIGRAILPNNPLGYGGEALLTVLELNCPNNAPPVFWKKGTYGGVPWHPLFERAT